ncbi:MAG: DMT family transporter [Pseudomonadales bacterium]
MTPERRALTYGLVAVALWSTVATGFKLGLEILEPLQLLLLGTIVSTVVFVAVALAGGRLKLARSDLGKAAMFGMINPFIYYVVLFEAYDRLPAQIAQPLNYTWAITLAILAWPILGQRPKARTMLGILVSYLGVVVLLTQGDVTAVPDVNWTGVGLALASTLLWASYWLLNTRVSIDPLGLMAWSFLFGLPCVALACWMGPGWPAVTPATITYGLWVGLVEMGVTFLLWQQALRLTTDTGRIGQLIFLSPFVSLWLIATFVGETIHATSVIGLVIIVAGLLTAQRPASA